MKIKFFKAHGTGNDYIFIDCYGKDGQKELPQDLGRLAIKMSARHISVGSDGLVLIRPSKIADASMRMFNADGSEGKMCGNAIRCVAAHIARKRRKDKIITIDTASGIHRAEILSLSDNFAKVRVCMKKAEFSEKGARFFYYQREFFATYVNVGNPHGVVFLEKTDCLEDFDIEGAAKALKSSGIFSEDVNTEFVKINHDGSLSLRVYERGSGETYACGTGACASVAAAVYAGKIKSGDTTVKLTGGVLTIKCDEKFNLFLTGETQTVFYGEYEYEDCSEL